MRWQGREGSENIEDARRVSGKAVAGGGGLLMIIIAVVFTLLRGGGAGDAIKVGAQQMARQAAQNQMAQAASGSPVDEEKDDAQAQFVSVVLKDTEDVWNELLPQQLNQRYEETTLKLFRGTTSSGCGHASSAVGPFYCPADRKVYLDLGFFDEMRTKFKAEGDFACAYVVAHEVGHHVQNLLGYSAKVQSLQARSNKVEANRWSVRLELQADYLAGVWAHHAHQSKQILEQGDIGEAIRAASRIGDDTLQKEATGRVRPDAFTHGTSEQRVRWFSEGLKSGDLRNLTMFFEMDYETL